jgi:hypothetical protein
MNENNMSFYARDIFEFIHHPKYGYHNHLELIKPKTGRLLFRLPKIRLFFFFLF